MQRFIAITVVCLVTAPLLQGCSDQEPRPTAIVIPDVPGADTSAAEIKSSYNELFDEVVTAMSQQEGRVIVLQNDITPGKTPRIDFDFDALDAPNDFLERAEEDKAMSNIRMQFAQLLDMPAQPGTNILQSLREAESVIESLADASATRIVVMSDALESVEADVASTTLDSNGINEIVALLRERRALATDLHGALVVFAGTAQPHFRPGLTALQVDSIEAFWREVIRQSGGSVPPGTAGYAFHPTLDWS